MADHYLYLDETGTLDFGDRPGERYFGVGSVHFEGDHRDSLWVGHQLRAELEMSGVRLSRGFHAKNDSARVRFEVYRNIGQQPAGFDVTMLLKSEAPEHLRVLGKIGLYEHALWLHLERVLGRVSGAGDRVLVVVGNVSMSSRGDAVRQAIEGVCQRLGRDRTVVPLVWDASSSWGIQMADYVLWAVQRRAEGRAPVSSTRAIQPLVSSELYPWGRA